VIPVKPKKSLGQHFLIDKNIAKKIVGSLTWLNYNNAVEIGPGMGVLSEYLVDMTERKIQFIELDRKAVEYLCSKFPGIKDHIISADILKISFGNLFDKPFAIIGNFPYNISSQLFFRIIDSKDIIPEVVCMIQKEVAQRIASSPGSKNYGILSVLLQAYYDIEYLFTVPPHVFNPPPKVQSAVIRLKRNSVHSLGCNEIMFRRIVKTAFNQRRKILRNSLKNILLNLETGNPVLLQRPEQLSVNEFVELTKLSESIRTEN